MQARKSLLWRITLGLVGYLLLLGAGLVSFGWFVQEEVEARAWHSILTAELASYRQHSTDNPEYRWQDTQSLRLRATDIGADDAAWPNLPPGVHDEVSDGASDYVVLIEHRDGKRLALALDISELETQERSLAVALSAGGLLLAALLSLCVAWGVSRLVRPLQLLATQIVELKPEASGIRMHLDENATLEQATFAKAINGFLDRSDAFVERERAFIDTASHELRTPMTVIAGAVELALTQPELSSLTRGQLSRIQRSTQNVERLLSLLLALAKAPEHLTKQNDTFALDGLLPEIVDDHFALLGDKALVIELSELAACRLTAPVNIVQAAIGNLLRNAIENSDSGTISITLSADAVVQIEDPGHQMSPEQISRLYAQLARGKGRDGGGIGLDLIARLCQHLGWKLELESLAGGGTRTRLSLGASLAGLTAQP